MTISQHPIDVASITEMQQDTTALWHDEDISNSYEGIMALACQQHEFNFRLWHEEDVARSPDVSDQRIAEVKRAIDKLNQQRNDWIEKIDDQIAEMLAERGDAGEAPINTETPGSAIDRLSIMALRLFHLHEQTERTNVSAEHVASVQRKIAVCMMQHAHLSQSLNELLGDLFAGRKRHVTYRQFKMYNDPALNPYLYESQRRAG